MRLPRIFGITLTMLPRTPLALAIPELLCLIMAHDVAGAMRGVCRRWYALWNKMTSALF